MRGFFAATARAGGIFGATYRGLREHRRLGTSVEDLKRRWASEVLASVGVSVSVRGDVSRERPTIFVGNHVSYLDIPLLFTQAPQANFVAKSELERWPLFGPGMREAGTIFVKRDSPASRGKVRDTLVESVRAGKSVAVFPSGTTTLKEDKEWKTGAFRLAEETGAPLQAFRLRFTPMRTAAFIDDDAFVPHLIRLCRQEGVQAEIEFAPPEQVKDYRETIQRLRAWTQEFVR